MKIKIVNPKKQESHEVTVKDTEKIHRRIRGKVQDEEVCPNCHNKLSECSCQKEEHKEEEVHDEKIEMTKEQFESFQELLSLLPDLKKLLKGESKEESEEEEESKEESKEEESKEEESEEEEKEEESDIILEEGDKEIESEEFDEDDVIEDECGSDVHDSALNLGAIEQHIEDSVEDTTTHELEVAESWNQRYEQILKHK